MGVRAWLCIGVTLAAALHAAIASAQAVPPPCTVLTIHSGAENYPSNPLLDAGIREALESHPDLPIDYFAEYLEADVFKGDAATLAFRDYLRRKYEGRRIDVVIAITGAALQFALDHRNELFPGAPIVFGGLIPQTTLRRGGATLTGVQFGNGHTETLKLALTLHPSVRRVFVIAKGTDDSGVASVQDELRGFSAQVSLTYINEPTVPRLLDAVRAVPTDGLILYIWHSQEEPGHIRYPDEIAPIVASAARVPVYGSSDLYIGSGVVGGAVRSNRETGMRLGEMAIKILRGTPPRDIPIEASRIVPIFDWRQIRRWGIDPSRLPRGTDIRFQTPTAWESYRPFIVGTVSILGAQLLLIGALLTQRGRRRRAEIALLTREATIRASHDRIRQLHSRVINAQEVAWAAVARELHDDICQELVGVSMGVDELKRSSGKVQDAAPQHTLSRLLGTTQRMVDRVRRLSHELHPASLRLVGLAAALRMHCVEVERRHDVQVRFETQGLLGDIDSGVALCLFRIAQEALRNGAVHGSARRLAVTIARSDTHVELTVVDDGRGFDVEAVHRTSAGLGLVSMEERAQLAGGQVHITSQPGDGTTVRVRIPTGESTITEDYGTSARTDRG